jgi:hypothetical protein
MDCSTTRIYFMSRGLLHFPLSTRNHEMRSKISIHMSFFSKARLCLKYIKKIKRIYRRPEVTTRNSLRKPAMHIIERIHGNRTKKTTKETGGVRYQTNELPRRGDPWPYLITKVFSRRRPAEG